LLLSLAAMCSPSQPASQPAGEPASQPANQPSPTGKLMVDHQEMPPKDGNVKYVVKAGNVTPPSGKGALYNGALTTKLLTSRRGHGN